LLGKLFRIDEDLNTKELGSGITIAWHTMENNIPKIKKKLLIFSFIVDS